jgi:hypothetical protein
MLGKNKETGESLIQKGIRPELPQEFLRRQLKLKIQTLREKGLS